MPSRCIAATPQSHLRDLRKLRFLRSVDSALRAESRACRDLNLHTTYANHKKIFNLNLYVFVIYCLIFLISHEAFESVGHKSVSAA